MRLAHLEALALVSAGLGAAVQLDVSNDASIKSAASDIAKGVLSFYTNSASSNAPGYLVGTFPNPPYFWWESGAAWTALIDYWAYTGDSQYNDLIQQAISTQAGPNYDFVVPQQAFDEGNDDQAFWVFTALSAMEYGFPALPCPSGTSGPDCPTSYLRMAEAAFDLFVQRWSADSGTCGGGLDWQFIKSNLGTHYKSTVATGSMFQIAARLAHYTGNQTYADWAERSFSWLQNIGLVDSTFRVLDGTDDTTNCTQIQQIQWTYTPGLLMYGCAMMYDMTGSNVWSSRLTGIASIALGAFFGPPSGPSDVMYEAACELHDTCNNDSFSFKAYLARWMAKAAVVAPYAASSFQPFLQASAQGAASACNSGSNGAICGFKWWLGHSDGNTGLGQNIAALEVIQALMASKAGAPQKQGNAKAAPPASSTAAPAPVSSVAPAVISSGHAAPTSAAAMPVAQYTSVPAQIAQTQASVNSFVATASPSVSAGPIVMPPSSAAPSPSSTPSPEPGPTSVAPSSQAPAVASHPAASAPASAMSSEIPVSSSTSTSPSPSPSAPTSVPASVAPPSTTPAIRTRSGPAPVGVQAPPVAGTSTQDVVPTSAVRTTEAGPSTNTGSQAQVPTSTTISTEMVTMAPSAASAAAASSGAPSSGAPVSAAAAPTTSASVPPTINAAATSKHNAAPAGMTGAANGNGMILGVLLALAAMLYG